MHSLSCKLMFSQSHNGPIFTNWPHKPPQEGVSNAQPGSICKHGWFSGRILACHAGGPGSIPGPCKVLFVFHKSYNNHFAILGKILVGISVFMGKSLVELPTEWQNDYNIKFWKWKELCMDRESNPGLPRGRREFYHWTIHAYIPNSAKHCKRVLIIRPTVTAQAITGQNTRSNIS